MNLHTYTQITTTVDTTDQNSSLLFIFGLSFNTVKYLKRYLTVEHLGLQVGSSVQLIKQHFSCLTSSNKASGYTDMVNLTSFTLCSFTANQEHSKYRIDQSESSIENLV